MARHACRDLGATARRWHTSRGGRKPDRRWHSRVVGRDFWFHDFVTDGWTSLAGVLDEANAALRGGKSAAPRVWPTGFDPLDAYLGGGLRAGELTLIGGPQGLGKTTWALQMMRNMAAAGAAVSYFSFEHDEQTLLERLICIE